MATIQTTYAGKLRTEIRHTASGQTVNTDAPLDNHGEGKYISPTDIFTASYASCIFTIMGIAAATHGFSIDGMSAETTKVMADNPRRVAKITVVITMPPNNYSSRERRIIEAVPGNCPVGHSLHPDIEKEVTFRF
ncbi:MAG: OsmC family protein [Prevotellaceae bacterium]|nr:OsmC family protein [Prevotellaceae bacterium]